MLVLCLATSQTVRFVVAIKPLLAYWVSAYDWPNGFAFFLSFLAPLWTICPSHFHRLDPVTEHTAGSFDSSVHISEEASNAATAVPWAIVLAIALAGILGWGMPRTLHYPNQAKGDGRRSD
jgi:amino acid transporter